MELDRGDLSYFASILADEMRLSPADQREERRFRAACAIETGMWANPHVWEELSFPEIHKKAVFEADALLAELDRTKEAENE